MKPRSFLISYDMADNRRRHRVATLVLKHGERHQKSLYMLNLDYDQRQALPGQLQALLHPQDDRLMLRPVCRACHAGTRFQGSGGNPEQQEPFWII